MVGKKRENQEMLFNDNMANNLKEKRLHSPEKSSANKMKPAPNAVPTSVEVDSPGRRGDSDSSQSMQQHHSDIEDGYKEFLDSQEDEACVAYEAKKKARNDIVPEEDEKEELDAFEGDNVFIDNLPKKKNEIIVLLKEVNKHIRMLEQQFFEEEDSDVEREQ